jgi:predicted O-methyltransferase YrrM
MNNNQDLWTNVDAYISDLLVESDEALEAALRDSQSAGLPAINVAPNQGKMLNLLARIQKARNILEIGTLGGYSTIWLARALPSDGRLVTLEYEPKHAQVAQANINRAGVANLVEIRVGRALDLLPKLAAENPPPFDLTFIDADKQSNAEYFEWAVKLSQSGSIIIVDNVVRNGEVIDAASGDTGVRGTRRLYEAMSVEKRVSVTAIQTVGSKGYDGFALAVVL